MKTSPEGIFALVLHEGIVPGPYRDSVNVWTYGVGHTAAAGQPIPHLMRRGMPRDMDEALRDVFKVFREDLLRYEADVNRAIKVPLAQHEFDAAVSFHYNTGAIGRASWVKKLNGGDRRGAAEGIMAWKKPPEIIKRRQAEQALFARGVYPKGKATVWQVNDIGRVIWKPARQLTQDDALRLLGGPERPSTPWASVEPEARGSGLAWLWQAIGRIWAALMRGRY